MPRRAALARDSGLLASCVDRVEQVQVLPQREQPDREAVSKQGHILPLGLARAAAYARPVKQTMHSRRTGAHRTTDQDRSARSRDALRDTGRSFAVIRASPQRVTLARSVLAFHIARVTGANNGIGVEIARQLARPASSSSSAPAIPAARGRRSTISHRRGCAPNPSGSTSTTTRASPWQLRRSGRNTAGSTSPAGSSRRAARHRGELAPDARLRSHSTRLHGELRRSAHQQRTESAHHRS